MVVMIMADTNIFTNWNILWSKSKKVNISFVLLDHYRTITTVLLLGSQLCFACSGVVFPPKMYHLGKSCDLCCQQAHIALVKVLLL
jgi:hypothetical protein